MRRFVLGLLAVFGGVILLAKTSLAAVYPAPTGYVNDFAGVISQEAENSLEERLSSFTASTSNEIAVVTLSSLEGDTVENAAVKLFEEWGIGDKEKDNGVLLLVAIDDRELRIEVGYGLEPVLTDSRSGNIIRDQITPLFKAGNYEGGIIAGTEAIISVVSGDPTVFDQPEVSNSAGETFGMFWFGLVMLFMYTAAFLSRSNRYWPGGVIGLIFGVILGGILMGLGLGILGLLFDLWLSKNYKVRKAKGLPTGFWSSTGGFSSSGSSFGGFSGGSSGGGGSSGSW
ncbi:MAG TPA: TPM domain-containing protein [Patescibacteria group bacterium]|nr:TPM domain-containing protein [Patescibacteria group bacterium]